uniref:Protein kinase domain-containing protein n=1 Tax=Panagrolaimus sp. ES5 TaxID=591445 RepID=A0AC34FD16_9BILA
MELVRGGSLQDYLKKNAGKINDTERLNNMASSAACGLAYLHSRSCIHRDIAARNCLYDKNKNVKISDFGLSREGEKYKMTQTQRVPIKWIAPECLINFTFTRSSDVFSFGVLLWEIFSDAAEPFEGKKTTEIKNLILNGVRLEFPAATPLEIKEMVTQHLWSSRPEDRYTMSDVVQRLEQMTGVKQPTKKKDHHKSRNEPNDENVYRDSGARRKSRREEDKGQSIAKKKGGNSTSKYRSISHSTSTVNSTVQNGSPEKEL